MSLRIPLRPPEPTYFRREADTRTWVDHLMRRRRDQGSVQSRELTFTWFTCIPDSGYCSAWERGIRHTCEVGRHIAWEHDPGDEDRNP